jgi:phenylpropionate dioxygenase-like ring-hydroxylating dioxygenase large terminal subunit
MAANLVTTGAQGLACQSPSVRGRKGKIMTNLYQQARIAGLNPNHWYAVDRSSSLRRGAVREITYWERSIALFRCKDGSVGAIANSCAHRRIKLTLGNVCEDRLVCPYHGWEYDTSGHVVSIPHDLFGRAMPELCVTSYPVRERYGLVWIFPGDRSRADHTPLPQIPELEGPHPWASVSIDFVWRAHFSIIIENLLDFTHAFLHRRYHPFDDAVLTHFESSEDRITAEYNASVGRGRISGLFVNRARVNTSRITSYFEYPYQRASTDDKIVTSSFLTPIDLRTTRVFFTIVFDSDALRIPWTPLSLPYHCARLFLSIAKRLVIAPILRQDGRAVEAEQEAVECVGVPPIVELNPVGAMVQEMIVRRWRPYETGRNARSSS